MRLIASIVRSFMTFATFLFEDTTNQVRIGNVKIVPKMPEKWEPLKDVQLSQWRKN